MKIIFLVMLISNLAMAGELRSFLLSVKDGAFNPTFITVPSGEKFRVELQNKGISAEEFESIELNREKIVAPGKSIILFIGPLNKGEYKFFGDFHKATAQGKIIAQ